MKSEKKIYFVYHYANDYHYDNGIIIGASTDEKECKRIAREHEQLSRALGFKNSSYKVIPYEPTDKFTYL